MHWWTRYASNEPLAFVMLLVAFWLACAAFYGVVLGVRWVRKRSRGTG